MFKTINSIFGDDFQMPPIVAFVLGSIIIWIYYFIIIRGIKEAGVLNAIITIAKLVPLILAIIFGVLVFKIGIFNVPNWQTVLASTGDANYYWKTSKWSYGNYSMVFCWC